MSRFHIYVGAGGRKFVGIEGQGEFVAECSRKSGAAVNSNRRDQEAAALLHSIGLHTQQEVINLHARGVPGYGPANPVALTSHCGGNDGVAIPWRARGARILPWESGIDLNDPDSFVRQARAMGEHFSRSYPGMAFEQQHINPDTPKPLRWTPGPPTLRGGDKGREVRILVRKLQYVTSPKSGATYLPYPKLGRPLSEFGGWVNTALKRFQEEHGLTGDAVYGPKTRATLDRVYKLQKAHEGQGPHRRALAAIVKVVKPPSTSPQQLHKGPVNGQDVSVHNGSVDWRAYAVGGNEFAFIRIADGDVRDSLYNAQRVKDLRANKIIWGPYYYARVASSGNLQRNGAAECDMAIRFAEEHGWDSRRDLPLTYDFEDLNKQSASKAARHLMQFARRYVTVKKEKFIFYTMPSFWDEIRKNLSAADLAFLKRWSIVWVAHWRPPSGRPSELTGLPSWSFWQNNDRGRSAGVSGGVDTNLFRGSFDKLVALTR